MHRKRCASFKTTQQMNPTTLFWRAIVNSNITADNDNSAPPAMEDMAPSATPAVKIDIPELFRTHRSHLLRFIQRYLQNSADAEDVLQDTFIETMRCADKFAGLSKPSTWLFGIALNMARSQVRRNCSSMLDLVDDTVLNQYADHGADPARLVEVRQIARKVDSYLDTLTPKLRTTFEAVLEGDITYEAAAEQLQIPIGTVRSRVSRVRASVKAELG